MVMPGFISVKIFAWITAYDRQFSEFDTTIYSLAASLLVYVPFVVLTQLDNLDKIRDAILLPSTIGLLIGLSVLEGTLSGGVVKILFRRHYNPGSVWDKLTRVAFEESAGHPFAIVATGEGVEVVGQLHSVGSGDQPKDILLFEPKLIIRNKHLTVTGRVPLGKELYLPQENIKRVQLL